MTDIELRALSAYVERDTALINAAITRYGELQQAPDYAAAGRLRAELEARGVLTPETAPWAAALENTMNEQQTPNLMEALKKSLQNAKLGEPTPPATPQPETPDKPSLANIQRADYMLNHYDRRSRADILVLARHLDQYDAARAAISPHPDVERLTREAFRAGFLAVCAKKGNATPLDILTRVWTFDGVAAADLEPEAYAAWLALSPSTPGEPT